MGVIKDIWGKITGKPSPSKYEVQIMDILETVKESEKLRNVIMEQRLKINDLQETIRNKDDIHKTEIGEMNNRIRELERQIQELMDKNLVLSGVPRTDNPVKTAIYGILVIRPKLRTKTIAEILGVSDRTVRGYRREFQGKPEKQNSHPDNNLNNQSL